jgi:hypothetical protein
VFTTTFVVTRTLRDERSRSLSNELVIRWYDGAAARVRGWLDPQPVDAVPVLLPKAAARSAAPAAVDSAPPPVASSAAPSEPAPPVVQLEDLAPLGDCTTTDCNEERREQQKPRPAKSRGRTPR